MKAHVLRLKSAKYERWQNVLRIVGEKADVIVAIDNGYMYIIPENSILYKHVGGVLGFLPEKAEVGYVRLEGGYESFKVPTAKLEEVIQLLGVDFFKITYSETMSSDPEPCKSSSLTWVVMR